MISPNFAGKTIILYNDSPAPVPASDPRYDFYTGNPDYSLTGGLNDQGGAPSTLPGYGPNTRTIMQFRVAGGNSGIPGPVDGCRRRWTNALTSQHCRAPSQTTQDAPVHTTEPASTNYFRQVLQNSYLTSPYIDTFARTFSSLATGTAQPRRCKPMKPKAIQELLIPNYGRMNATLGVELPFTNSGNQTTIPLGLHRSAHRDLQRPMRPRSGRSPITAWTPTPSTSTCSTCR